MVSRVSVVTAFLAICVLVGGGGSPAPFSELIVEIAGLAALVLFFLAPADRRFDFGRPDWPILAGAAVLVAIPVVQLVPLPPGIWQALPDRATEAASLALVGDADGWTPVTLVPYQTFASLLSLIPPLAMLAMVARLPLDERARLLAATAALGCMAAIVGLIQLSSGNADWLRFYQHTQYGYATGFQANRNADADLLLCAIVAVAATIALGGLRRLGRLRAAVGAGVIGFLALSVVATGSRAGVALIAVALVAAGVVLRHALRPYRGRVLAGLVAVVAALGLLTLNHNGRLARTWDRFSTERNVRTQDVWPDTLFAIRQSWPAGTGIGTFMPVFQAVERLEVIGQPIPNRAHNDYLEFALEAGIVAVLFLVAAFVAIGWRTVAILRARASLRHATQALAGSFMVIVFALHSLVDYPLRSMALAGVCGLAIALLAKPPQERERRRRRRTEPVSA